MFNIIEYLNLLQQSAETAAKKATAENHHISMAVFGDRVELIKEIKREIARHE